MADELKRFNKELMFLSTDMIALEEKTSVKPIELNQVTEVLRAIDPI